MLVDIEKAVKLHEYYMDHKTLWLSIADILRTDNTIVDKMVTILGHHSDCYVANWLKRQAIALKGIKSPTNSDGSCCFCRQADDDFDDQYGMNLCGLSCIVDWGSISCVVSKRGVSPYDRFLVFISNLVHKDDYKEDAESLAKMAEEIANLPFRYQTIYNLAMKEGVNE